MHTGGVVLGVVTAGLLAAGATSCASGTAVRTSVVLSAGADADGGDVRSSAVCDQVRQGIAAFNQGNFRATVQHFTQAVPLAHERVVDDDTPANEQLLEAVVYYAELAPADYLRAAGSSPDFQVYKTITLGQCGDGSSQPGEPSPSSSGLTT